VPFVKGFLKKFEKIFFSWWSVPPPPDIIIIPQIPPKVKRKSFVKVHKFWENVAAKFVHFAY
jgi:hypothetical protein